MGERALWMECSKRQVNTQCNFRVEYQQKLFVILYFSIAHLALFVNNNYTSAEKKNKMMAWTFSRTLENLRVWLNGAFTHNLQLQSISGPCLTAGTFSEAPFSFAPHPATALPTPGNSSAPPLCYLHSVSNSSYPVTRNSGVQCLVRHAQIPGWH